MSQAAIKSEGSETLEKARVARGLSNQDLARLLGFDEPLACRLRSGKRKPNRSQALRMRDEFGIDPASWDRPSAGTVAA